jgi:uncharacterized protein (DUF58 family)
MSIASYGAMLDALRGVHWPARRPVRDAAPGTHRSRMRGSSVEFTEYRPYRQGDDPRRLDWRLLARSDRAYIRLATDRAIQPTMLLVDASASMAYPPATMAKWVQARRLAVGLAALAHADGDPIGAIVASAEDARVLAPRSRRGVLAEVARTLDTTRPAGRAALTDALGAVPRGARLAVISDFLEDGSDLLRGARSLVASGSEVHAVHVVAGDELAPRARGVLATDPEDDAIARPLVDESYATYVASFSTWREETAEAWRAAGALFTMVLAEEPAAHAVRRIAGPSGGAW